MTTRNRRPIPLPDSIVELRKMVVDYWNAIAACDDLGEVPGSLVHETEVRVSELLDSGDPWDAYEASRITAAFEYQRKLFS